MLAMFLIYTASMQISAQLFEFCVKQSFYFTQLKLNLNPLMIVVRTKATQQNNMHTYLPTLSIHKAFDVHTNSTCAFIKNGKLWLVVEKSSHLL